jgi:flagellar biosynthesis protein FliQ
MQIPLTDADAVTKEKVDFVENQANELYGFLLESRAILNREAHTTLNWLFGIIIASAGYIVKICSDPIPASLHWLLPTLVTVIVAAAFAAVWLFHRGLRIGHVHPTGNEPKHLVLDEYMQHPEHIMRLAAVCQMQERIESARTHNHQVADTIDQARWSILTIVFLAVIVSLICGLCRTTRKESLNVKLNSSTKSAPASVSIPATTTDARQTI